ncbi:beta-lactamase family protein [Pendulispora brunnea]|uniref:Beta-lactamase family protein n=1 Tax=Pendulispora brunnea TaxID=2905690 RepID=A0ABZ2KFE8_9BACT
MKLTFAAGLIALSLSTALFGCAEPKPRVQTTSTSSSKVAVPSAESDALARRVDAVLDAAVAEGRIVGTVAIVAKDGAIVYRRAAGFADREGHVRMREDTPFRLASMTKPIVSATALALVDRGALHLDDPVTKYLPNFRPHLADGRVPVITVRQLLTHTSGLNYGFFEPNGEGPYHRERVSDGLDQPGLSLEENLTRLGRTPLLFEPGTKWNYSLSTDVLGAVIAKAGGAPLPDLVARFVTGPLGMDASFSPPADPARLAVPYADGKPRATRMSDPQLVPLFDGAVSFSPSRVFDARSYASGGAGMVGTADGYIKFLEAVRTGAGKVLSPASATAFTTNQVGNLEAMQPGGKWGFSFGLAVLKTPDPTMPSHPGTLQWGGAWGHSFFVDPTEKLSVVVLTNTAFAGMIGAFPDAVRNAVYGTK